MIAALAAFGLGLFVGATFGVFVICALIVGAKADD